MRREYLEEVGTDGVCVNLLPAQVRHQHLPQDAVDPRGYPEDSDWYVSHDDVDDSITCLADARDRLEGLRDQPLSGVDEVDLTDVSGEPYQPQVAYNRAGSRSLHAELTETIRVARQPELDERHRATFVLEALAMLEELCQRANQEFAVGADSFSGVPDPQELGIDDDVLEEYGLLELDRTAPRVEREVEVEDENGDSGGLDLSDVIG